MEVCIVEITFKKQSLSISRCKLKQLKAVIPCLAEYMDNSSFYYMDVTTPSLSSQVLNILLSSNILKLTSKSTNIPIVNLKDKVFASSLSSNSESNT